ncbi:MAG: hypothetical protein ACLQBQ_03040 [Smithella sp.]
MENKAKLMIDYNKEIFETYFNSVVMLQEQMNKALDNMLKQTTWIPEQTKSFINEWIAIYKNVTFDFKESVDQNYSKIKEALTPSVKNSNQKNKKNAKDNRG